MIDILNARMGGILSYVNCSMNLTQAGCITENQVTLKVANRQTHYFVRVQIDSRILNKSYSSRDFEHLLSNYTGSIAKTLQSHGAHMEGMSLNNSQSRVVPLDCLGVLDGNAFVDQCGICGPSLQRMPHFNHRCADCKNVAFGNSSVDQCGVCDFNPENDCRMDCAGTWGGKKAFDECAVCDGTAACVLERNQTTNLPEPAPAPEPEPAPETSPVPEPSNESTNATANGTASINASGQHNQDTGIGSVVVQARLILALDYEIVSADPVAFTKKIKRSLATTMGIPASRISVDRITAGSLVIVFSVTSGNDTSAEAALILFSQKVKDGTITKTLPDFVSFAQRVCCNSSVDWTVDTAGGVATGTPLRAGDSSGRHVALPLVLVLLALVCVTAGILIVLRARKLRSVSRYKIGDAKGAEEAYYSSDEKEQEQSTPEKKLNHRDVIEAVLATRARLPGATDDSENEERGVAALGGSPLLTSPSRISIMNELTYSKAWLLDISFEQLSTLSGDDTVAAALHLCGLRLDDDPDGALSALLALKRELVASTRRAKPIAQSPLSRGMRRNSVLNGESFTMDTEEHTSVPLSIIVLTDDGSEVGFQIKSHAKLRRVLLKFAAIMNVDQEQLSFQFNSSEMHPESTASDVGLYNGATVLCKLRS